MANRPEATFGIKDATPIGAQTGSQKFALIAGLVYIALGVIGFFITGFGNFVARSDSALLGIFHLNPFHNVVHIALGAILLFAALALTPPATEGVLFIMGAVLIVVAILGYRGDLDDLLAVPGGWDPDNVLHVVLGVVTLLFANPVGLFEN